MAEFWSNSDRGYSIRMRVDAHPQNSDDIANNRSRVKIQLALLNTVYTFAEYNCSAYVDFDGGRRLNWSGRPSVLGHNQVITLIDQTVTIAHNADGKKNFGLMASFSGSGGWSPGTLTIGGNSFTLSTIPRSSSVSVGAGVIGSSVTININRQSSSFKHTVRYHWGNKQGTIATNVDTSTTWTIPNDFANDIPNSTSGTGTIYVDTYSGGTKTGTQATTLTASVPASMKPIFSGVTLTDTNGVARGLLSGNNFLQIISNIQVNFNGASGSYGSRITGYYAEIVNKKMSVSSNGGKLGAMNFHGSATIRASVTDSRGRQSATKDITINVIEYFSPILSFTANRTRENPSIIQIVRNAKVAPIAQSGSQKNVMTLSFKVAPLNSESYTADNGSASGTWLTQSSLSNSAANMANTYAPNKSFKVIGTLEDKFTSTTFSATITTERVVMGYDKDGRVGVGKVPELGRAGSLDVAADIYADGKPIQQYRLTYPEGNTIYAFNVDINTLTNNGTRWIKPKTTNSPFPNAYGYVETYRATTDIMQIAWSWYDGWKVFRRSATGYPNNTKWTAWTEITPVDPNSSNLINTGWNSAGYSGSHYKRSGDMLAIKFGFTGNGSNMAIGTIPPSVWTPPQEYMLVIPQWSIDGAANTHIQFNNGSGVINAISTKKDVRYRGQILIMI